MQPSMRLASNDRFASRDRPFVVVVLAGRFCPNADPHQGPLNWARRVGSGLWTGWRLATGLAPISDRIHQYAKAFAGTERPVLRFDGIRAEMSIMVSPETHYARSGDVRIAYQVVGSGPLDLVYVPGFVSNLDVFWEMPEWARFFSRLAAFSRLIVFDKRGTGLSDRDVGIATLEERMDDVRAVMDAAGSTRAALYGVSEGGPLSVLFAATYPQRVRGLILYGSYTGARLTQELLEQRVEQIDRFWGTGQYWLPRYSPKLLSDETARRAYARFERQSANPSAAIAIQRMNRELDIRHVLPAIRVPSLVMHRVGDAAVPVEWGRELAEAIPNARYVELPGDDHVPWHEPEIPDRTLGEIEEFLTGSRTSES